MDKELHSLIELEIEFSGISSNIRNGSFQDGCRYEIFCGFSRPIAEVTRHEHRN